MQWNGKTLMLAIILVWGYAGTRSAAESPTAANTPPIPLRELEERGVEGRLGVRLGTIVEVTGRVVPNTSSHKEDQGVPFFLSVRAVNGRPLENPAEYRFQTTNQLAKPTIGEMFRYVAYETGAFTGSPEGEFAYVRPYATTGYAFKTTLVLVAAK